MKALLQIQNDFQNYLFTGQMDLENVISATPAFSASSRLTIYNDAYQSRLHKALASNFPQLQRFLGHVAFEKMARDYIQAYPSNFRSIRWFGDKLADFLQNYYAPEFQFLSELALFEWNRTLAFDALDAPAFQLEKLALIPKDAWPMMTFQVQPSLKQMTFVWDVVSIWEHLAENKIPRTPLKNQQPSDWIVWRHEYLNRFRALPHDEAWAIKAISHQQTFADLCLGLNQWHDEYSVGTHLACFLKNWVLSGFITDIILQT